MIDSPDFDRKMLLLATQISKESEMSTVLLTVLEALLKTLKAHDSGDAALEAIALLRCIIRLILKLVVDPTVNRYNTISSRMKNLSLAARYS